MNRDPAYLAELRRTWRRNWLESLAEFADYEIQRRGWLGDPAFGIRSFVECMCGYFDDDSLSSGYAYFLEEGFLTPEEAQAVQEFHAAADAYASPGGDDDNHQAILSDPDWLRVVSLANESRLRLLTILKEPAELSILLRKGEQPPPAPVPHECK